MTLETFADIESAKLSKFVSGCEVVHKKKIKKNILQVLAWLVMKFSWKHYFNF